MSRKKIFTYIIATVWLINGLFCKVLGFVPRHQEIVQKVLSLDNSSAYFLIKIIGVLEVLMSLWVISRIQSKFCAVTQISIILLMNTLEFLFAKHLLLWSGFNFVFAFLFCTFIFYTEFKLKPEN